MKQPALAFLLFTLAASPAFAADAVSAQVRSDAVVGGWRSSGESLILPTYTGQAHSSGVAIHRGSINAVPRTASARWVSAPAFTYQLGGEAMTATHDPGRDTIRVRGARGLVATWRRDR